MRISPVVALSVALFGSPKHTGEFNTSLSSANLPMTSLSQPTVSLANVTLPPVALDQQQPPPWNGLVMILVESKRKDLSVGELIAIHAELERYIANLLESFPKGRERPISDKPIVDNLKIKPLDPAQSIKRFFPRPDNILPGMEDALTTLADSVTRHAPQSEIHFNARICTAFALRDISLSAQKLAVTNFPQGDVYRDKNAELRALNEIAVHIEQASASETSVTAPPLVSDLYASLSNSGGQQVATASH